MERRLFGDGVRVSVLGCGCGRVGSINNTVPMKEIEATLDAAIEAGVNLFDTADIYAQGDSERTVARVLRRHRERMFVVTKVGGRHSRYAGAIRFAKPLLRLMARSRADFRDAVVKARAATVEYNFQPQDLRLAVDASRRRLRVDQLDGLLLHSPSIGTLRDPKVHDFLADLVSSGRARYVGASVKSLPEVEAALSVSALRMLQVPVAVANMLPDSGVIEHIRQRNIAVFVREILEGVRLGTSSPREAISRAIAPDFVTAVILGLSTRRHLNDSLAALA
jgi:aryl-alcohol dehydrogenase-like predicted oxidoreductase